MRCRYVTPQLDHITPYFGGLFEGEPLPKNGAVCDHTLLDLSLEARFLLLCWESKRPWLVRVWPERKLSDVCVDGQVVLPDKPGFGLTLIRYSTGAFACAVQQLHSYSCCSKAHCLRLSDWNQGSTTPAVRTRTRLVALECGRKHSLQGDRDAANEALDWQPVGRSGRQCCTERFPKWQMIRHLIPYMPMISQLVRSIGERRRAAAGAQREH